MTIWLLMSLPLIDLLLLLYHYRKVVCCCRQPYADNAEILDSSGVSGDFALFGIEQISIPQMFDFFLLRKSEC